MVITVALSDADMEYIRRGLMCLQRRLICQMARHNGNAAWQAACAADDVAALNDRLRRVMPVGGGFHG